ncbi:putative short-chain type dehydrogenase/reductase [Acanthamoeba polyphaga mimivirus]|uniref:Short-chain type dehydrogenase/reductase n=1 Tax=Acanthamoeba polyphaga mimivirus Kroon TaxID=3069720 RepID=A0A0G2Y8L6_9VIRU|nr:putative short-chain type dehydrogenase/reductase [Acanthamoeba polyphaga mimivirus]AKI80152.1 putative short-chain type dehydrogenase/reductase [Acanthamoeba polyphaga mimivirus Kroon]
MRFSDSVVLIFGGTTGIGLMTTIDFIIHNTSHIILASRSEWKWKRAIDKIRNIFGDLVNLSSEFKISVLNSTVEYIPCDIRIENDVKQTIQKTIDKYHYINVYFNNAGVQPTTGHIDGDITEIEIPSEKLFDGTIVYKIPPNNYDNSNHNNLNHNNSNNDNSFVCSTPASTYCENPIATFIMGMTFCLKHEVKFALEQKSNIPVSIINMSSRNGVNIPSSDRPIYSACKAFIHSMTQTIATQSAKLGIEKNRSIRVNCIAPGPILTPLEIPIFLPDKKNVFEPLTDLELKQFQEIGSHGVPMKRTGSTNEISPTVLFLADYNQSSYITGSTITIDGGYTASPLIG